MSFYLGPGRPVTALSTWNEIETAGAGGLLGEHQWVELKKDLGPANKGVNLELAKDLASLAVDGGLLFFGVDDDGTPVGCDASVIIQRVSQVAAAGMTPPLSPVIHDPVPHPDDGTKSVLIVSIPASPVGPHMVDGRYWGRSSDGKRALSDPEVRRLMQDRGALQQGFTDRLRALEDKDPLETWVVDGPQNGHLYLLAEPLAPIPSAGPLSDRDELRKRLTGVSPSGWATGLDRLTQDGRDPDGAALVWTSEQVQANDEKWLTYVSVKDDGRIVMVSGGGTALVRHPRGEQREILIGLITRLTHQTLQLLRGFSLDSWGYQGPWNVGIRATRLAGLRPNTDQLASYSPFTAPEYARTTVTTPATTDWSADETADQLLSGFYRGLGLEGWTAAAMLRRG